MYSDSVFGLLLVANDGIGSPWISIRHFFLERNEETMISLSFVSMTFGFVLKNSRKEWKQLESASQPQPYAKEGFGVSFDEGGKLDRKRQSAVKTSTYNQCFRVLA